MTARFRSKSIANVAAAFVVAGLVCGSASLAAQDKAPEKVEVV